MLDELSWETLKSRRIKLQLTNLYKVQHNLIDLEESKYLTKRSTTVRSKHSSQLTLYLWSITAVFSFLFFSLLSIWHIRDQFYFLSFLLLLFMIFFSCAP